MEKLDQIDQNTSLITISYSFETAYDQEYWRAQLSNILGMIQQEKLKLHTFSKHKETTIVIKNAPTTCVKFESRLKDYNGDPFEDNSAICILVKKSIFPWFKFYSKLQAISVWQSWL